MDEKAFSRSLLSAERTPGQLRNFSNKRGNGLWSRGVTAVFGGWSFEKRRLCRHKPARLIRPTRLNIGSLTTQCGQIEPVLPPSLFPSASLSYLYLLLHPIPPTCPFLSLSRASQVYHTL